MSERTRSRRAAVGGWRLEFNIWHCPFKALPNRVRQVPGSGAGRGDWRGAWRGDGRGDVRGEGGEGREERGRLAHTPAPAPVRPWALGVRRQAFGVVAACAAPGADCRLPFAGLARQHPESSPHLQPRRGEAGRGGPGVYGSWKSPEWKKGKKGKSEKRKKVKNGSGHPGIELRSPNRTSRHRIRAPLSAVPKAAPLTGLARFSTHYRLRLAPLGAQLSPHQVRREGTRRSESGR